MAKEELLKIEGLEVGVGDKTILKDINLTVNKGEVHVIMGPNGSGKSSLANAIMGNPLYNTDKGSIYLDGEDITDDTTDKRARKGLFMSFQSPQAVPGITVQDFIRQAKLTKSSDDDRQSIFAYQKDLKDKMEILEMNEVYKDRYLNQGFSGGEKKKTEILQLLMLEPKLAILDETDSGLDVDAVRVVSKGINEFLNEENALIIITHHREILREISPDFVHIIYDGGFAVEGGTELIDKIEDQGFGWLSEGEELNG